MQDDGDTEEAQDLRRAPERSTAIVDQAGQVAVDARWRARIARQREAEAHAR